MAPPSASEAALSLHATFLEILRRLNQADSEGYETGGLEHLEIARAMDRFWTAHLGTIDLDRAMALLVDNGLVAVLDDPAYSWIRGRPVGRRYRVTPLGKAYLLRQIAETGRIR